MSANSKIGKLKDLNSSQVNRKSGLNQCIQLMGDGDQGLEDTCMDQRCQDQKQICCHDQYATLNTDNISAHWNIQMLPLCGPVVQEMWIQKTFFYFFFAAMAFRKKWLIAVKQIDSCSWKDMVNLYILKSQNIKLHPTALIHSAESKVFISTPVTKGQIF